MVKIGFRQTCYPNVLQYTLCWYKHSHNLFSFWHLLSAGVQYAELDGIMRAAATANELVNRTDLLYHLTTINAPGAWDTTLGRDTIRICIMDTGVTYT